MHMRLVINAYPGYQLGSLMALLKASNLLKATNWAFISFLYEFLFLLWASVLALEY